MPLALALASCSGGGGSSPSPSSPSKPAKVAQAHFTFTIPLASARTAAKGQKRQYLPATTQSIEVQVVDVNGAAPSPALAPTVANVSSTAPGCAVANGNYTCTVTVGLPIGSDTVLVQAFDAAGATGDVLSQQQSTFTVVAGLANNFSMTLDATPGAIALTAPSGAACSGSPITDCDAISGGNAESFAVTVADTHGTPLTNNAIPGSPVLSATTSDGTLATVTVTQNPYGIAITPTAALPNPLESSPVTITVTATPATTTSGLLPTTFSFNYTVEPPLTQPYGIAVDASGNVYVADIATNLIYKYASSGAGPTLFVNTGDNSGPDGVALDASGDIYVSNSNGTVTEYGPAGGSPTLTISNGLSSPGGVALDASGNIYVADEQGTVTEYTAAGAGPILTISGGLSSPTGVVVDASGYIYVSDMVNNTLTEYGPSGGMPTLTIGNGVNSPLGVALDANADIYSANFGNGTVTEYAAGGGAPILTIGSGLVSPAGVAVDASGNIYVTDVTNDTVTKYVSTGGNPTMTISTRAKHARFPVMFRALRARLAACAKEPACLVPTSGHR